MHIERVRYIKPRSPVNERSCPLCNCVEGELHSVTTCSITRTERKPDMAKFVLNFQNFPNWTIKKNHFMPKLYRDLEHVINPSESSIRMHCGAISRIMC